jgi:hypothetical protein
LQSDPPAGEEEMSAELVREFTSPEKPFATFQGNV